MADDDQKERRHKAEPERKPSGPEPFKVKIEGMSWEQAVDKALGQPKPQTEGREKGDV